MEEKEDWKEWEVGDEGWGVVEFCVCIFSEGSYGVMKWC
jgi:hypothetical protein